MKQFSIYRCNICSSTQPYHLMLVPSGSDITVLCYKCKADPQAALQKIAAKERQEQKEKEAAFKKEAAAKEKLSVSLNNYGSYDDYEYEDHYARSSD